MSPEFWEPDHIDSESNEKPSPDQAALGMLASLHVTTDGIDLADKGKRTIYLRKQAEIKFSKKALRILSRINAESTEDFLDKAHALLAVQNFIQGARK